MDRERREGACARPSRGRYVRGCRCEACTRANREYWRRREKDRAKEAFGAKEPAFVDAEPVRDHVRGLLARGYTKAEICRVAGVSRSTMRALTVAHGRTGRPVGKVNAGTARKIMAVGGQRRLRAGQLVGAGYVRAGIERCVAAGMSVAAVSRLTGIDRHVLDAVRHRRRTRVTAATLHRWVASEPALMREAARHARG